MANFGIPGGTLSFMGDADYETKKEYVVTIKATGSRTSPVSTVSTSLVVTVKVTDVPEDGTVTLSARQPQIGKSVTAELEEMDGGATGIQWRWGTVSGTRADNVGDCIDSVFQDDGQDIAPSASYRPVDADDGMRLCAQASYFDDAEPADADPPANEDTPTRDTSVGSLGGSD